MASVSFLKTPYLISIKITDLVLQTGLDLTETGWTVQLWRYLVKSNPIESRVPWVSGGTPISKTDSQYEGLYVAKN